MAAFATNAQMLERYDARVIGDLVADDDTRVASGSLGANTVLTAFLEDASGLILAACLKGERYTEADLTGLTGNSAKHLIRITCDIAMAMLYGRRMDSQYIDTDGKAAEKAEKHLERLRRGEHVFDVTANKDAGLPTSTYPSLSDSLQRNGLRDSVQGLFPARRVPLS